MKLTRVLLVDDHPIFLESLQALLTNLGKVEIVAKAVNGIEALKLLKQMPIDVVITDLSMPLLNGIDFTVKAREISPHIKVILLTMTEDMARVRDAMRIGAWGYILKSSSLEELQWAIKEVVEGRKYFGADLEIETAENATVVVSNWHSKEDEIPHLTKREIEIIRYIVKDKSSEDIAKLLNISPNTIETHRRNIFKKLDVKTVVGLMRFAIKHNLID
ncbi:response regulator transcription factor [Runella sp. MFBS21]|uniref:response regulator n=1 Tax=Runella sp. MFBS21 TaxID=3034018 RepID=UPI0023F90F74|nr:response regulator transcription factor [Runella sp. MFBS21]MDF7816548.1 response regulator transcription factor [Runella sp. MFBS21]